MKLKAKHNSSYFVYILLCANGAYYTGITKDLEKRFHVHRAKRGAKYTKAFSPLRIAAVWKISGGRSEAQKVECYIRKKGRQFKESIIAHPPSLGNFVRKELSIRLKPAHT
jgi:putative endonuclease